MSLIKFINAQQLSPPANNDQSLFRATHARLDFLKRYVANKKPSKQSSNGRENPFGVLYAFMLILVLQACENSSVQLCGEFACVAFDGTRCEGNDCAQPRACESASSIRDRAPAILNELRVAQRRCNNVAQSTTLLVWDNNLSEASTRHSRDMANFNFDSFTGSDGSSSRDRANDAGVFASQIVESVGRGPQTSAEMINTWLEIPTDCGQLLNPQFTRVAMACSASSQNGVGPFWSLLLASPE